jgi:tetratricopeptide (TPR) repeat protein
MDALYSKGELRLEYDAAGTKTAAQAFETRSGNCLSLVMMTSAFAKAMGLVVHYQVALDEETWDRTPDTVISIGHVNLTLDDRPPPTTVGYMYGEPLIVDFLPPKQAQHLRVRVVSESSIVAMYLNNRAVESLTDGNFDVAYWWAREAITRDPELMSSYVTLAVIYRNRHRPDLADQVLSQVLRHEPDNTKAMSNEVLALRDLGKTSEATALAERLAQLNPHPPFSYYLLGRSALQEGRFVAARDYFAKEVDRAPYHHEFHYWLAIALLQLNDLPGAATQLAKASEVSTTRKDHDRYAAKLERLKMIRQ